MKSVLSLYSVVYDLHLKNGIFFHDMVYCFTQHSEQQMEREVSGDWSAGETGDRDEGQLGEQGAEADLGEGQGHRGC